MFNKPLPADHPVPPDKKMLSAALEKAILAKDIEKARQVFDTAFWSNIELVPDWYNLLVAVSAKNKPMIKLLATHGAEWTKEEACCLKSLYPRQWQEFTDTLRDAGIRQDPGGATGTPDIFTSVTMRYRIIDAARDSIPEEEYQQKIGGLLSKGVALCLLNSDTETAVRLLRRRNPSGAVDMDDGLNELLRLDKKSGRDSLAAIDRLKSIAPVRPLKIGIFAMWAYPQVITGLDQRNLLSHDQPNRIYLIKEWGRAKNYNYKEYKGAAAALFKPESPLTEGEAGQFVNFFKGGKVSLRICEELLEIGFFNSPVWTKELMRFLGEEAPEGSSLKREFNRKLAGERFGKITGKQALKTENLNDFISAHRNGYYQAHQRQAYEIIQELHREYKNGRIPDDTKDMLRAMKDGHASFIPMAGVYAREENYYLGKKEPGLAKILLNLGILKPKDFDLPVLHHKAGLPTGTTNLYRHKGGGEYAEFFFQVYLEKLYPGEFMLQRGKINSYHEKFKEKIRNQTRRPPINIPPRL